AGRPGVAGRGLGVRLRIDHHAETGFRDCRIAQHGRNALGRLGILRDRAHLAAQEPELFARHAGHRDLRRMARADALAHARRDECDDLERRLLGCRLDLGDDLARAHHVGYLLGHRDDLAGDRAADLRARCAPRLGALHLRPEPLETDLALASLLAHVADLLVVAADLA